MTNAVKKYSLHAWAVTFFFICASLTAWWLTPHQTWFDHIGKPDFEQVIPRSFDNWVAIDNEATSALIIDPQQVDAIKALYTQNVTRTYTHLPSGRQIMLSLAYGDNQVLSKQLHRPESCYSSQGFKITNLREERLGVQNRSLPVFRMAAQIGNRLEQVSYWIRIADKVLEGPPGSLNIARMKTGLEGYIADGLLFRVSNISSDGVASSELHGIFINDLLNALTPQQRALLVG